MWRQEAGAYLHTPLLDPACDWDVCGEASHRRRLCKGSHMGVTTQKGRRARELPGQREARWLMCLGDMAQQHGGSLTDPVVAAWGLMTTGSILPMTTDVGWGFVGYAKEVDPKWLRIFLFGLIKKKIYIYIYIFGWLGLGYGMWDLQLWHAGSSSLTRDWTPAPCFESTES